MPQGTCPECVAENREPRPIKTRGLCGAHYTKAHREGRIEKVYQSRDGKLCEAQSCDRPVRARGLCAGHYARQYRGINSLDTPVAVPTQERYGPTCTFDGCDGPMHSKGLCGGHYWQQKNNRPLTPIGPRTSPGGPCEVTDCPKAARWSGLCSTHYMRHRRGEDDWDRPIKAKGPDGGGHIDKHGYRYITVDGRSRREHLVMAEQVLGRPLLGQHQEDVHHVNTRRDDNWTDGPFRLNDRGNLVSGNLEIWAVGRQPRGGEVGPQLEAAVGLLETYGEFLTDAQRERVTAALAR